METITIESARNTEFIDITARVHQLVREAGAQEGLCVVFCPHTTAGLTINECADSSVQEDILKCLQRLVPYNKDYTHREGNSDAHIKSVLVGQSLNVIIHQGKLALGTWQGIYFCEFDGPRARQVWIKII